MGTSLDRRSSGNTHWLKFINTTIIILWRIFQIPLFLLTRPTHEFIWSNISSKAWQFVNGALFTWWKNWQHITKRQLSTRYIELNSWTGHGRDSSDLPCVFCSSTSWLWNRGVQHNFWIHKKSKTRQEVLDNKINYQSSYHQRCANGELIRSLLNSIRIYYLELFSSASGLVITAHTAIHANITFCLESRSRSYFMCVLHTAMT